MELLIGIIGTGVKTKAKKFITKEMLEYAHDIITSGSEFTSADLKSQFPKEYNQGSCVFSMTGGILELVDVARCIPNPSGRGFAYISINKK